MSNEVDAARLLMADSLGFHIIFALFGVGLPVVFLLIEHLGLRRKDPYILEHARRLSQAAAILVVAGVASGTIIAIQMSLMWGKLIEFGGPILGLSFGWEGYAFIIEAVFLALYITTWGKIKGWKHWWLGVPIALGSMLSALSITLSNAWMQNPSPLSFSNGQVVGDHVLEVLFSKTAFFMVTHSVAGYYLAAILSVLGIYAYYLMKNKPGTKETPAIKKIMFRLGASAVVVALATGVIGHFQTQYLADSQPRKFARIEQVEKTTSNAPYVIGGHINDQGKLEGGIKIPSLLSILTGNSPNKEVKGLNEFPKETWPKGIISSLFEAKMALVALVTLIPLLFVVLHSKKISQRLQNFRYNKLMLSALLPLGLVAIIIIELGWIVAELGRQPYAVNGYLKTEEAFSATGSVQQWGYIFPVLFLLLFIVTFAALTVLVKTKGAVKPAKELLP